ncbi:hypothetical protein A5768_26380 [Mycolicibacterium fortuitum]|uniref:hypothetical protein n=1 Tax=Mycolicibacterium fortuitum TaxID=1766 RepID=UPI0007E942AB|nr:hypothetical protein [Mycolicibacterium fortuitum]OBG21631.1 hypothetical protein A5768_26380 [Mycolicibacterium fortuitum]
MEPNHLIEFVDKVFQFQPKPHSVAPLEIPTGITAIEQATAGLYHAVNAITESDHTHHLRDWNSRRDRALEWRHHLTNNRIPDAAESSAAISRGEMSVTTALFGTDRYEDMLTEFEEVLEWSANRHTESARKHQTIADSLQRASGIRRRGDERVQQVRRSCNRKIKQLRDSDTDARRQIVEAGQRDVRTAALAAVARTNALTRQILDLDEDYAVISVPEWLERHHLDTSLPD